MITLRAGTIHRDVRRRRGITRATIADGFARARQEDDAPEPLRRMGYLYQRTEDAGILIREPELAAVLRWGRVETAFGHGDWRHLRIETGPAAIAPEPILRYLIRQGLREWKREADEVHDAYDPRAALAHYARHALEAARIPRPASAAETAVGAWWGHCETDEGAADQLYVDTVACAGIVRSGTIPALAPIGQGPQRERYGFHERDRWWATEPNTIFPHWPDDPPARDRRRRGQGRTREPAPAAVAPSRTGPPFGEIGGRQLDISGIQ